MQMNRDYRIAAGTNNSSAAHLINLLTGRVIMTGTLKECRSYKRKHYDAYSRVYLA